MSSKALWASKTRGVNSRGPWHAMAEARVANIRVTALCGASIYGGRVARLWESPPPGEKVCAKCLRVGASPTTE